MLKRRTLIELLFAVTLVGGGYYLLRYVPKHAKAGEPVLALSNYFLTYSPIQAVNRPAYVVPDTLDVWDTPAEIRTQFATLRSGDQVRALGHFRTWTHVRLVDGHDGWVVDDGLMSAETHEAEAQLLDTFSDLPVQATGHSTDVDNLHVEPSRSAAIVAQLNPQQSLEIFGRKLVRRSSANRTANVLDVSSDPIEAWYLVRAGSHAGWILGHRVQLAIPKSIEAYAEDANLVAWLKLDAVSDNGRMVPQYVVAERSGTEVCDFTKIQVLTWWKKKQTYAVAYRESDLQGYFPILVTHEGSVPHFRLRLMEDDGSKYQKVYGLFDTITHVIGTANSWQSDATPIQLVSLRSKARR